MGKKRRKKVKISTTKDIPYALERINWTGLKKLLDQAHEEGLPTTKYDLILKICNAFVGAKGEG